jgi:integrase
MNDAPASVAASIRSATEGWRWPLDPSAYDRSPGLKSFEIAELAYLVGRQRFGCWSERAKRTLSRLRLPVQDVMNVIRVRPANQCTCATILLLEMHRRQMTFWGWQEAEWIETICTSPTDFCKRHSLADDTVRPYIAAVAYILCCFVDVPALGTINQVNLSRHIFGHDRIDLIIRQVVELTAGWGFGRGVAKDLQTAVAALILANRSPTFMDMTVAFLDQQRRLATSSRRSAAILNVSRVLVTLGYTGSALPYFPAPNGPPSVGDVRNGVPAEWITWVERWRSTTTLQAKTRRMYCVYLYKAGRWLAKVHPECATPAAWTREIAAECVATVCRLTVGEWMQADSKYQRQRMGKPLAAATKGHHLVTLSSFFRDCQEWEWIPRRFDSRRCFGIPRSLRGLIAPNPRVIADDVWAKLLWAGLNLSAADLPVKPGKAGHYYPVEMVKAVTIVWLFCGLRMDEVRRLRTGCILGSDSGSPDTSAVCCVSVPANKTSQAFTKPVDRLVGEAVKAWETIRPPQPLTLDEKTGDLADFLFMFRGKRIAARYINDTLVGILCRKAGMPTADARGNITSHRARSTIATQLFNAKEPMSLFELQRWLGHKWAYSTEFYLRISATRLANSYRNAEYFARNVRAIEVLIDRDVVLHGKAAEQPWKFYDLGHGYCTYDFFDQCPHRMACAKCSFYIPKNSTRASLLEGKANLSRMRQEIPLQEAELAAVEDGVAAFEKLLTRLADVPTPAGPTPRQLHSGQLVQICGADHQGGRNEDRSG